MHLGNVSRDTKKLLWLTVLLIVFSRMVKIGLISTIHNSLDWNTVMQRLEGTALELRLAVHDVSKHSNIHIYSIFPCTSWYQIKEE